MSELYRLLAADRARTMQEDAARQRLVPRQRMIRWPFDIVLLSVLIFAVGFAIGHVT